MTERKTTLMTERNESGTTGHTRSRLMTYGLGGAVASALVLLIIVMQALQARAHAIELVTPPESVNAAAPVQGAYTGQWIIQPNSEANSANQLNLTLTYTYGNDHNSHGQNINSFSTSLEQLRGLTAAQMASSGTNVQFQIVRDAGSFNCEGWFKGGNGSGHFTFVSSPAFVAELRRRNYETPTEKQMFSLAMDDIGLAFLDELQAQGYERPTLDQLVRMGDHGVSLEYVRALKAQGYKVQSLDLLTRMVDHGVSVSFIQELDALGYKHLPTETLIRTVDHGVGPGYIKELAALGHHDLPLEQLTRLVDHGVSVQYIKEIDAAGYGHPSLDELVRMQDHGVTAQFIGKMKSRGFNNLTIEQLIKLADNGFED